MYKFMKRDFITTMDYSKNDLNEIISEAIAYKNGAAAGVFADKILTLIFANPSLRTRLSFESAMKKLGGHVNVLSAQDSWNIEYQDKTVMNGDKQEHIKEVAKVLAEYSDIIAMRHSSLMTKNQYQKLDCDYAEYKSDLPIRRLAEQCPKPVINMESNMFHPCQSMADAMTIKEKLGGFERKKYVLSWAPHPRALPLATAHSQLLTPAILGMDVVLACPPGFELDDEVMSFAGQKAASFSVEHDQKKAFKGADVIVAKSWISIKYFSELQKEAAYRARFADWIINSEKMKLTDNAYFMHCLPIRRNVVATDEVVESDRSLIIQEAGNRMWVQMAIINYLLK